MEFLPFSSDEPSVLGSNETFELFRLSGPLKVQIPLVVLAEESETLLETVDMVRVFSIFLLCLNAIDKMIMYMMSMVK